VSPTANPEGHECPQVKLLVLSGFGPRYAAPPGGNARSAVKETFFRAICGRSIDVRPAERASVSSMPTMVRPGSRSASSAMSSFRWPCSPKLAHSGLSRSVWFFDLGDQGRSDHDCACDHDNEYGGPVARIRETEVQAAHVALRFQGQITTELPALAAPGTMAQEACQVW
jgi:hypothetical protein